MRRRLLDGPVKALRHARSTLASWPRQRRASAVAGRPITGTSRVMSASPRAPGRTSSGRPTRARKAKPRRARAKARSGHDDIRRVPKPTARRGPIQTPIPLTASTRAGVALVMRPTTGWTTTRLSPKRPRPPRPPRTIPGTGWHRLARTRSAATTRSARCGTGRTQSAASPTHCAVRATRLGRQRRPSAQGHRSAGTRPRWPRSWTSSRPQSQPPVTLQPRAPRCSTAGPTLRPAVATRPRARSASAPTTWLANTPPR
mmetsp:Transcript_21195/g.55246  ORF Transcript_21195/g.55246 Transcript_21195/m.55246 type:complete len:258 (-) Transcript_21195:518-1291(-)